MQKKILFLSHSAGRTGAPIFLLQLVKWLKATTSLSFQVVHLNGGELLEEFQSTAATTLCIPEKIDRYVDRLYTLLGIQHTISDIRFRRFFKHLPPDSIGLVYSNTICNGAMLSHLAGLRCPVICHVHEMESMIRFFGKKNIEQNKACATHYIAVSERVKQNLIRNHGIRQECIDIVYPCLDIPALPKTFLDIRSALNIPQDAFIVFASGKGICGIKGKDLFIQLAYTVLQKRPDLPVYFLWVGGDRDAFDEYLFRQDVERAGLSGRLRLIYDVPNPLDYFNAGDVIVSVSREDSFPLVCLEAAALGKPVLCFDRAGGMPEFVENDAGYIVPYLDIIAMADKIIELVRQPDVKNRLGLRASEKVRLRHDAAVVFPSILQAIQKFF